MSKKYTKINTETDTRDLVEEIARAEGRSMGKQIEAWARKDAKRLQIGTRIVPKPTVPQQPDFTDSPRVNKNGNKNDVNRVIN